MTELLKVDLVGVGLNALDTLIPFSSFPARGSKTEYTNASIMPGGQAATTVIACQTWGLTTRYAKVGDDEAANLHRREFVRAGVDARLTTVANALSPQSLILVDSGGERTVLCRRDERLLLQPHDLDRSWIVNARALHVDGFETAAATIAAEWAHAAGIPVIADLDEIYPAVEDLIANVDYLIVSRDFPFRLTGERRLDSALRLMKSRYRLRSHRRHTRRRRRAGLGRQQVPCRPRLPGAGSRHHGRWRHFSRRLHLRIASGLAPGPSA